MQCVLISSELSSTTLHCDTTILTFDSASTGVGIMHGELACYRYSGVTLGRIMCRYLYCGAQKRRWYLYAAAAVRVLLLLDGGLYA